MSVPWRRQEIEAQAARWVIRLGADLLREEDLHELEQWLAKNPAHGTALQRAQSTWAGLAALKAAPGGLRGDVVAPSHRGNPGRRPAFMTACAAVFLAVLLTGAGSDAFWFGNPMLRLAADYQTVPGESRTVTLSDGSIVQLDTASALAVHFNGRERLVKLLSGEAYFIVAPMQGQETRPFVAETAKGTAMALGTQFMVRRQGDGADVTVIEHRVRVMAAGPGPGTIVLSPGQSVRYSHNAGLGKVTEVDLNQVTAWRRGRLIFNNVRLADAVAELNRYRRGRIVIADTSLADRRVSGVFETADLQGALASVTQELGVKAVSLPPFVTLLY